MLTNEEIAAIVYGRMDKHDIKAVKEDAPNASDMIRYHHTAGRAIRNEFGLWENRIDPDAASNEILEIVWRMVHA